MELGGSGLSAQKQAEFFEVDRSEKCTHTTANREGIVCESTASIAVLELSTRCHNALKRAGINTIGKLVEFQEPDDLLTVRNLGEKGINEIFSKLAAVTVMQPPPAKPKPPPPIKEVDVGFADLPIVIDLGLVRIPRVEVVSWQRVAIAQQIQAGLLDDTLEVDGIAIADIVDGNKCHERYVYRRGLKILAGPVSVVQESERVLARLRDRQLNIMMLRHGYRQLTLQEIAEKIGVSRERIRQLETGARSRVASAATDLSLLRMRSAIAFADNMDLSFDDWTDRLLRTGLLGDWTEERFKDLDPIETILAVCSLLNKSEVQVSLPEPLALMLRLRDDGKSSLPARTLALSEKLATEEARLVRRHLRHSGAVSLDWLAEQLQCGDTELHEILCALDLTPLDNGWYLADSGPSDDDQRFSVFQNTLAKMFTYCGELSIHDIMFGLEHKLDRANFPVPPVTVLEEILTKGRYASVGTKWYAEELSSSHLSDGEKVIMRVLVESDGVAHHAQLAQAFLRSHLSMASLHGTLKQSPLFDKFDHSLYKARGSRPSKDAIERARNFGSRIRTNLEVKRDSHGNIKIAANLSTLAIGNGTITSEKLPNLEGDWLSDSADDDRTVRVTRNEVRGLLKSFQALQCEVGDRVELTFNTWTREVSAQKIDEER